MVSVVMSLDSECLLRQVAADLDVSVEEMAAVLLESALMTSMSS